MLSGDNIEVDLIVGEQAHPSLLKAYNSGHDVGNFPFNYRGISHGLYYGCPQAELLLVDEKTFDRTMGSLRAIITLMTYQLRAAMGDITKTSFKRQIFTSLGVMHRMLDHLAGSETTLFYALICAKFSSLLCQASCGPADSEYSLIISSQEFLLRAKRLEGQSLHIPESGILSLVLTAQRTRLRDNSSELLYMANVLRSNVGDAIRRLPQTTDWVLLLGFMGGLHMLRLFVRVWIWFTGSRQVSISRSWAAIKILEDQIMDVINLHVQRMESMLMSLES